MSHPDRDDADQESSRRPSRPSTANGDSKPPGPQSNPRVRVKSPFPPAASRSAPRRDADGGAPPETEETATGGVIRDRAGHSRMALDADDTGLATRQVVRGSRPGDRFVRIPRTSLPDFKRAGPGLLTPQAEVLAPKTALARARRFLLGKPLPTEAEAGERVGVLRGLAIFASDNISSSAYATEEIMRVLILAGVGALTHTIPITLAIVAVLAIVVLSYRQVIAAYPEGGGSYVVAHENLGRLAGLTAGAALLTDYILTVAVSTSAGVTALTSAFPTLYAHRVLIALTVVTAMTIINLRGITESGRVFTIPTYVYVISMLGLLGYGLVRALTGDLPAYTPPPEWTTAHGEEALGLLLVLRAFASGSVALTGTEAVSNGVPAFQPPEPRNAKTTLVTMGLLFATIFVGISYLAGRLGIVPDPDEVESVNSILTRALVGHGWYFYLVQFATSLLLVLAANTAFNGFPRLASVLAHDHYLPRQFSYRGDRLAFTGGIVFLAVIAGILIAIYDASVTGLIPLYTVGVFIAFTLSQAGLVRRWWQHRDERGWQARLAVNGAGAIATGVVAVVVGVSKFALGAWMVLVLIPALVWAMWQIRRHYVHLSAAGQGTPETPIAPGAIHVRAIVPIADLHLPARQAIAYALAIAEENHVVAVHVTDDEEKAEALRDAWRDTDYKGQLVVIDSPYRSLIGPLVAYIDATREAHPNDVITVILPEYVPAHWWEHLLHNQTALRIKAALLFHHGVVVANVPYHMPEV
jgi:amino acid transporter